MDFYESDDASCVMLGKKDYVSVKIDDKRVQVQKRLILCTLKELHQLFLEKHPETKIGFSLLAMPRTKECVLSDASGTHSACVCHGCRHF